MLLVKQFHLFPRAFDRQRVSRLMTEGAQSMKAMHDKGSLTEHIELSDGQKVRVWLNGQWKHRMVSRKSGEPRSYAVRTRDGGEHRRNRIDIRPSGEPDHMFAQVQTETTFGYTKNDQVIVQTESRRAGQWHNGAGASLCITVWLCIKTSAAPFLLDPAVTSLAVLSSCELILACYFIILDQVI